MIQGKIKSEPVEEEEDFDEKQSDASDLENHEDDEVEIIGMMECNESWNQFISLWIHKIFKYWIQKYAFRK